MAEVGFEAAAQQLAAVLLGSALVGIVAHRIGVPYAIALVLVGVALGASPVPTPVLEPGLVLFVLLPPLLFDAAFRLDARELKRYLRPVLFLAVPGVLLTALIVGGVVAWLVPLGVPAALLFGSVVATTDPVAVIAVFRRLGAPPGLSVIAEGESLVNDATAITLYTVLLGLVLTGTASPVGSLALFAQEVVGGIVVGGALGFGFGYVARGVDDHLLQMVLSMALAWGSYLAAQSLHMSGPLACVVAGIVHGTYGRALGMPERDGELLDHLWEFLGFVANIAVFLLVGLTVNLGELAARWWPVSVAVVAVVLARALVVGLPAVLLPESALRMTRAERTVLVWGGLRGAVTIALVLAVPADVPERGALAGMAFGVVLFTLVVQGLTLPALIRRVGLAR